MAQEEQGRRINELLEALQYCRDSLAKEGRPVAIVHRHIIRRIDAAIAQNQSVNGGLDQ